MKKISLPLPQQACCGSAVFNQFRKIMLALPVICFTAFAQAQPAESKIDPVFRYLQTHRESLKSPDAIKQLPEHYRLTPTLVILPGKDTAEERFSCIIYATNAGILKASGIMIQSELPGFVTALATIEQIDSLSALPEVTFIKAPHNLQKSNDVTRGLTGASLLHAGRLNNTIYKGKGVIIGFLDTGIDWDHPDFRNPADQTKSRILRIWDQTLTPVSGEVSPTGFSYGVEYNQAQINNEIDGTPTNFVREKDTDGHGTMVAGVAAGNGAALTSGKYAGMAPEADIIMVKAISNSGATDTRLVDGITYLKNVATSFGKPIVINLSLNDQYGPHDGTDVVEVAQDNFNLVAGRATVASAGNDGDLKPHHRTIISAGATGNISFTVPSGSGGSDVFYYNVFTTDTSTVTATLAAPGFSFVNAPSGQTVTGYVIGNAFKVEMTNKLYPTNNQRYVEFFIYRNGTNTVNPGGTWTLSLTNNSNHLLVFDGWVTYVNYAFNPYPYSGITPTGGNNEFTIGSPACAVSAITVGSFTGKDAVYTTIPIGSTNTIDSITPVSSRGPIRRNGYTKPEMVANGEYAVSSRSSDSYPGSLIYNGLYTFGSGTSFSAPVVAGTAALMLQAKPGMTAAQIKTAITSTATKDVMTESSGTTPNSTWGYGKVNAYKAVANASGCITGSEFFYKRDSSTSGINYNFTTEKVAVKLVGPVTNNTKIAGAFINFGTNLAPVTVEVRSADFLYGTPSTVIGSVTADTAALGRNAWTYIDLSSLNITPSALGYFISVSRTSPSTAPWQMMADNVSGTGGSYRSTDGGASWLGVTQSYKIRVVSYIAEENSGGIIASYTSSENQDIATNTLFFNPDCQLINKVVPTGSNPISGYINSNVWKETSVPHFGSDPFVARHYQVQPAITTATVTSRVTLYFTQAEFNAFNSDFYSALDLPNSPTDAAGISRLRIGKYSGTSNDNSGMPWTYSSTPDIINPDDADIVWNYTYSRWEVSFDMTGFGGLVVQTKTTALPIKTLYFTGNKQGSSNVLDWKLECGTSDAQMEIERSADANTFTTIGKMAATQTRCQQPFSFTDASPLNGANYYRLKIIESNGNTYYTNVVLLKGDGMITGLYPSFIKKGGAIQVSFSGNAGTIVINDATGKQVFMQNLRNGVQSISLPIQAGGVYFYRMMDSNAILATGKLVIE